MSSTKNLISVQNFAALKKTNKPRIYSLIEGGFIEATEIAGRLLIDLDKYKDYEIPARIKKAKGTAETMKEMNNRLRNLENIVYAQNTSGRGKNKVGASSK